MAAVIYKIGGGGHEIIGRLKSRGNRGSWGREGWLKRIFFGGAIIGRFTPTNSVWILCEIHTKVVKSMWTTTNFHNEVGELHTSAARIHTKTTTTNSHEFRCVNLLWIWGELEYRGKGSVTLGRDPPSLQTHSLDGDGPHIVYMYIRHVSIGS